MWSLQLWSVEVVGDYGYGVIVLWGLGNYTATMKPQNFSTIDLTGQSQNQPLPCDSTNANNRNISGAQLQNAFINANSQANPQMSGPVLQNSGWNNQNEQEKYIQVHNFKLSSSLYVTLISLHNQSFFLSVGASMQHQL